MTLYEVQFRTDDTWDTANVWEFETRNFSRFLDYLFYLCGATNCEESKAMVRVRRIPYEYGLAEWHFNGYRHTTAPNFLGDTWYETHI